MRLKSIKSWTVDKHAHLDINILKQKASLPEPKGLFIIKKSINIMALSALAAGLYGMLYALPYLFSSNMADLIGAGFAFIAGAILSGTAIIAMVLLKKRNPVWNTEEVA